MINKKKKNGLSTVVAALLLVLLTIVLVGIVWTVVNNLVTKQLPNQGCIDSFGKVNFNNGYTCYNSSSKELQFSINVQDIAIDKAVITISGEGTSKSIEITNQDVIVANVRPYNKAYGNSIKLPGKNSGLTYAYNLSSGGFTKNPTSINVVPVIGTDQCSASDSTNEISDCLLN